MSVSIDVLRAVVSDYFSGPEARRELEVIRARLAGGEPMERIEADYRDVPPEVLCAICRRPDVV
jgi:hypothetical protein